MRSMLTIHIVNTETVGDVNSSLFSFFARIISII